MSKSESETVKTGHLRPDRELAKVFSGTVRDMLNEEHGAVKAGANRALLMFLADAPEEIRQYNLARWGYDDLDDLRDAVEDRQAIQFQGELNGDGDADAGAESGD